MNEVESLILFAILVRAAGTQLIDDRKRRLQETLEVISQLMTRIVHYALLIAPFAVASQHPELRQAVRNVG